MADEKNIINNKALFDDIFVEAYNLNKGKNEIANRTFLSEHSKVVTQAAETLAKKAVEGLISSTEKQQQELKEFIKKTTEEIDVTKELLKKTPKDSKLIETLGKLEKTMNDVRSKEKEIGSQLHSLNDDKIKESEINRRILSFTEQIYKTSSVKEKQSILKYDVKFLEQQIHQIHAEIESLPSTVLDTTVRLQRESELKLQEKQYSDALTTHKEKESKLNRAIIENTSVDGRKRQLHQSIDNLKEQELELKIERDIAETEHTRQEYQEKLLQTQRERLKIERELSRQTQNQQDAYEAIMGGGAKALQNRAAIKKQAYEDAQANAMEEITSRTAKTFQKFIKAQEEYEKAKKSGDKKDIESKKQDLESANKEYQEDLQQAKTDASQGLEEKEQEYFQAEMSANLAKAVSAAVSNTLKNVTNAVDSAIKTVVWHRSGIMTRIQGENVNSDSLRYGTMRMVLKNNLAVSPFVSLEKTLDNLSKLTEAGIAYNLEERAFLGTISDKIATTFDVFDSNLMRLIRLQQADTSAARLGMEASLTRFLNTMFADTSYLNNAYDNVSQAIIDANATMSREDSSEFEYVLQKWLGSLYSLGFSDTAVSKIAEGVNYLATGNVQALAGNTPMQTLLAMSTSRAGMDYADMLLYSPSPKELNNLLKSMVEYLREIAQNSDNQVVKSAYGDLFNMSLSDMRAVFNLNTEDIQAIYEENKTYNQSLEELYSQFSKVIVRTSPAEMLNNIFQNTMFTVGDTITSSLPLYVTWLITDTIEKATGGIHIPAINIIGNMIDLSTYTVEGLMKVGLVGQGLLSSIGSILSSMSNIGGISGSDFFSRWGATEFTPRGNYKASRSGVAGSTSEITYVGTSSSDDIKKANIQQAADDAKDVEKITNPDADKEKSTTDLYELLINDATRYTYFTEFDAFSTELGTFTSSIYGSLFGGGYSGDVTQKHLLVKFRDDDVNTVAVKGITSEFSTTLFGKCDDAYDIVSTKTTDILGQLSDIITNIDNAVSNIKGTDSTTLSDIASKFTTLMSAEFNTKPNFTGITVPTDAKTGIDAIKYNTGKDGKIVKEIENLKNAIAGSGSGDNQTTGLGGIKTAVNTASSTLKKALKDGLVSTTAPKGNVADTINAAVATMGSWFTYFEDSDKEKATPLNYMQAILTRMDSPFTVDIPQHASGTKSAKRGYALVGERGPELVMMKGNETVLSNSATMGLLYDVFETAYNSAVATVIEDNSLISTQAIANVDNIASSRIEKLSKLSNEIKSEIVDVNIVNDSVDVNAELSGLSNELKTAIKSFITTTLMAVLAEAFRKGTYGESGETIDISDFLKKIIDGEINVKVTNSDFDTFLNKSLFQY